MNDRLYFLTTYGLRIQKQKAKGRKYRGPPKLRKSQSKVSAIEIEKKKEENVKGEGEDNKDRREEEERREVAEQSEVAASPL